MISSSGNCYSEHYTYHKEKTSRAIIAANIDIKQAVKGQLPVNFFLKVFDTHIRPILEYAGEVWCSNNPKVELELFHLKLIKTVLGVNQITPTAAVYRKPVTFQCICDFRIEWYNFGHE